ncbi:Phage tail length tape-measure protein [Brachybacterium faecium]|nr:Phage tail length tape-measure protein [Brachybacterium faecium]
MKLGSTDTEAKQLTTSARNLFKQGFGESLDNVNNSLTQTKQLFGDMGNDEVQEVTKSSLTLANTFDTDVNEVLRGGKNLMTNFGISSKVAYDLMAKGGQEGLDFSQEMFDNISEYSVQFKKAGYSSQDMFAIMAAGSKNGVMNMDKVNDTVKEFGVRIGDGSKGVDGGMSAMTSATRKLWEQFKQGEATSSQVFSAVTKDLGNMKNENDRNNAGVALMGTQWEDVGSKAITAMGKAKGATFEAKGTIDVMNKTVSDSNPWQKMGRNAQTVFAGIGQNLAPLSKNIGNNLNDMFANIPSMGDKIKTIFGDGLEGKKIDILSNYFDIGTVAAIIDNIGKVKEKFTEFKTALKGGTGNVFGGFVDGFNTMKTVIMSAMPAIKSTITGAITTFKAVFNTLKPFIMPIITQIVDIFKGIFTTLKTFWAENGTMIITAITNVIKGIQTAIQFILPIIKPVLAVIFSIISGVISNIKGVIQGGLSVIMGVIKIFSGLFTGNFSKMWEGIKQVFAGAIKFVWNAVNLLLVGRVLKGIKLLATGAKALVSGMWAGIKGFFTSGVSTVWNIYKSMPTRILNGFKTLGTGAKNVVSNMWSGIKGFFSKGISSVWNGIKSLPSKVINLFKNMKDGVFGWVKKMIDNVKDMPHRMAEGIKSGASALKNKFKSMFVGVVNVISKPVNGILGGINWVLDKVGATELPTWKVPAYAKGTDSHAGGLAMINDGKGKHYKEAVQNPDGSTFIAQGRNVVMPLQKGAKVLNGNDTNMWMQSMNIPHYANGIGNWFSGAWDSTKNVASKAWAATKEFAGDIWDYAKNPMKIVKDVVNSTLKPILGTMSKAPLSIAKGAVNTTFGSMGKWIKGIFEESGGTSGNVTGGAKAWIPNIRKAAKRMNVDLTPFGMESILKRITKESNGSASVVNNWDSNAKAGMPSKGLLQYIQPTLNSWVPKGVKPDLGNGYTQLLAMFNDSNWLRDINMPKGWGPTGIKRYANGGFIKKHQIAEIGEEGEEVIIPLGLNRRERAIQLLHKTMDRLGVSRDSGNSTIKTDGNINSATTVVNDNSELVALLTQQNSLLTQLVNKDSNTYLDSKKLEPAITKQQQSKDTTRNFFKGVIS